MKINALEVPFVAMMTAAAAVGAAAAQVNAAQNSPADGNPANPATSSQPASSPAQSAGRFTMTPVEGGFLRLDSVTGAVSLCARKAGALSCDAVPDDRKAMQSTLDRLTLENQDLRRELAELQKMVDKSLDGPAGEAQKPKPRLELPSEEDIDKALSTVDRLLEKFRRLIEKHRDREAGKTF